MGAIIAKLWTPMTLTEERRLKSTAMEGDAPPHSCGGRRPLPMAMGGGQPPTPSPKGQGGSGLAWPGGGGG
jgi:hypothetical protein